MLSTRFIVRKLGADCTHQNRRTMTTMRLKKRDHILKDRKFALCHSHAAVSNTRISHGLCSHGNLGNEIVGSYHDTKCIFSRVYIVLFSTDFIKQRNSCRAIMV